MDPRKCEGWCYAGGGIYRHVWLNVADPLHVVPWGVSGQPFRAKAARRSRGPPNVAM
ncbi:MAG: hypothetical protein ACYCUV_07175 [Phycisphaerae bacterium]